MLAEQFLGQHLLQGSGKKTKPELYYWLREGKTGNAELDYLLQWGAEMIPLEVKAGKKGSMHSLREFCKEKQVERAIRFDLNLYSAIGPSLENKYPVIETCPIYAVESFLNSN